MTHVTPAVTTRPLYHIAMTYGADYTDVLQVADGIKRLLTDQPVREAWFPDALERVCSTEFIGSRDEPALYHAIQQHVSDFVALQSGLSRPLDMESVRLGAEGQRLYTPDFD